MTPWLIGGAFLVLLGYLKWEAWVEKDMDDLLDFEKFKLAWERVPEPAKSDEAKAEEAARKMEKE